MTNDGERNVQLTDAGLMYFLDQFARTVQYNARLPLWSARSYLRERVAASITRSLERPGLRLTEKDKDCVRGLVSTLDRLWEPLDTWYCFTDGN